MKKSIILLVLVSLFVPFFTKAAFAQSGEVSATVRPNPLDVSISVPSFPSIGQWFNIDLTVSNQGSQVITDVNVSLNNPQGLSIKGKKSIDIGSLGGGEFRIVTWQAKTNISADYIIQVDASGTLSGETITSSDSVVVSTVASLGRRILELIFGNLFALA